MAVFLGVSLYRGYIDFVESESVEQTRFLGTATVSSDFASDAYVNELCELFKKGVFGLKRRYEGVVFNIHSGREIYRKMLFPFGKEQVEKTIVFEFFDQIRDVVKLDIEDVSVDYIVLASAEKSTQVLALAAPIRPLLRMVEGIEKYDMDPEKVIPEIGGLQSFITGQIPLYASGNCFGLHTTPDGVFIYSLQNGLPSEVRFLKLKLGEITPEIASEKKLAVPNAVEPEKDGPQKVVSEFEEEEDFFLVSSLNEDEIDTLAKQKDQEEESLDENAEAPVDVDKAVAIKRILVQIKRTSFLLADLPTEILVTGAHAYDKELLAAMNVIGLKVYKDEKLDFKHASAVGASISFYQKDLETFNLRKGALAYKGFFEKIVGPLNWCIILLVLVTVSMTAFLQTEIDKAGLLQKKYRQYSVDVKNQIDPEGEMKKYGEVIFDVKFHLEAMNKLLDFEANSDRYEEKHPIISCLRVWLEYERTLKRSFEKEKLTINSEKDLTIKQGSTEVILSINDAKAVDIVEMEKFLNLMQKDHQGYFNEAKQTANIKDPKLDMVVFDFLAKKKYRDEE